MIKLPRVLIEGVSYALGDGATPLFDLVRNALGRLPESRDVGAVVAATFSNSERFPPLSVRAAAVLGLPAATPAFDIQMACSAYPYALYVAGRLASDTGKKVLVLDGDVQTPLVDKGDHATGEIFSDAATCSVVSCGGEGESAFDFLSRENYALSCAETDSRALTSTAGMTRRLRVRPKARYAWTASRSFHLSRPKSRSG